MSDEHLWQRPDQGAGDEPPGMDQTQPIAGPSGRPPTVPPTGEIPSAPEATPPYAAPPGPGAVPPAPNPYGSAQQNPYDAPSSQFQPPPNPYPQPGSFDQYAPAGAYGTQPYGAYPAGFGAGLPDQPSATTAMVLGIVGLVGIVFCGGLTLVLSPVAWAIGRRSVAEIDANPGRYGGRDKANAGRIMGIVGTVLLLLGIAAVIGIIALFAALPSSSTPPEPAPFQGGNGVAHHS